MGTADKIPIREISRRYWGLSRQLPSGSICGLVSVEPSFQNGPTRPSKLDPFVEKLRVGCCIEQRQVTEEARNCQADACGFGTTWLWTDHMSGSQSLCAGPGRLTAVRATTTGRGTFVCLWSSALGRRSSVDWSEDWAVIGGERVKAFKWPISSLSTARIFWLPGLFVQRTKFGCLMPTGMPFVCSVASQAEVSIDQYQGQL